MLLMLEADFPDGKNPEFCAKLFREEPGVWKLKMEQFKRWLEKGKNDPLPEYYGTGKNCSVCGVFLSDTKSYLKHMKRNHGYKIKEKDKQLLKSEKKDKQERPQEEEENIVPVVRSELKIPTKAELKIPTKAELKAKDPFDMIMSGSLPSTSRVSRPPPPSSYKYDEDGPDSDLDDSTDKIDLMAKNNGKRENVASDKPDIPLPAPRRRGAQKPDYKDDDEKEDDDDSEKGEVISSSSRRRAAQKPEFKDETVTCPECNFQTVHSKIVSHLKRCTKKMAQAKGKPEKARKNATEPITSTPKSLDTKSKLTSFETESEIKKPKESDIVKKVFLKKFEAQQKSSKFDYFSDSDADLPPKADTSDTDLDKEDKQPSLKMKFSRKESSSEASHFEVSNDNVDKDDDDNKEPQQDTSLSAILRNLNSDRAETTKPKLASPPIPQITPPKDKSKSLEKHDDSSDEEAIPQKSFRLHSFIESLRAMQARLPQKKDDPAAKQDAPKFFCDTVKAKSPLPPPLPESPPKAPSLSITPVESTHLKNKWLQSLENRNKVKPPEPTPVVNKIQSDIAQLKDKNSLIYSKAKLKCYPDTPTKPPPKEPLPSPPVRDEEPTPVKKIQKTNPKREKEPPKEEYHDGRPSLRKGKMIPCPICGAEYAIANTLQNHIDKDHFGETDRVFLKRVKPKETKEKEKTEPAKKKKKGTNAVKTFEDDEDEDDLFGDTRPSRDNSTAEEKFDSLMASSSTTTTKKVKEPLKKEEEEDEDEEEEKLTEYEIFQKLQLKETSKSLKKKVECTECGKQLPPNTIKRHLQKHEKDREAAAMEAEQPPAQVVEKPKPKPKESKAKPKVQRGKKAAAASAAKKKETKPLKEERKAEASSKKEDIVNDNIPMKKKIMMRHLMKPQSVSESSDNEKIEEESQEETKDEVKPSRGRKKANPTAASNVLKRNLSKQAKLKDKKKAVDSPDMYAPIEITPTKEYWEYEKEKADKSLDFPSESEQSMEEEAAIPPFKKTKKAGTKRQEAVSTPELVNKSVAEVRDSERSRNTSEEELEAENPLEAAVRKVVSYRMTPKQALSHYNLTPKVTLLAFRKDKLRWGTS